MQAAGGAAAGLVGGLLGQQKEGATNQGNLLGLTGDQNARLQQVAAGTPDAARAAIDQNATSQVQNSGILGGLYGQNGLLNQSIGQEQDLANNGFGLTESDNTAYGQGAANIARQFGQNDQSLSQSLSDRGLSSSGVAGSSFSGSLGNKNEQLGELQTQIAQNRMQMNQQRLQSMQNFVSQLGSGANSAISSQFGQNQGTANTLMNIGQNASNLLGAEQGQSNEQLQQMQQTQHGSGLSAAFNGGMQGVSGAVGMANTMSNTNKNNAMANAYGSMN